MSNECKPAEAIQRYDCAGIDICRFDKNENFSSIGTYCRSCRANLLMPIQCSSELPPTSTSNGCFGESLADSRTMRMPAPGRPPPNMRLRRMTVSGLIVLKNSLTLCPTNSLANEHATDNLHGISTADETRLWWNIVPSRYRPRPLIREPPSALGFFNRPAARSFSTQ